MNELNMRNERPPKRIKVEDLQKGSRFGMQSGADQPVVAMKPWKSGGAKELTYAIESMSNNLKLSRGGL
jgi:hypothetical protein